MSGRSLDEASIAQAAQLAMQAARPIDDIRGSAAYRREMVRVCVSRSLHALANSEERAGFPEQPVLLWGEKRNGGSEKLPEPEIHIQGSPIVTRINGKTYTFTTGQNKTLLRLLREEAGLTGTKEGCAEGECGACTVFLDGKAVMSCLVPAVRAHGAEIVTVEGLALEDHLHPVQQAFIEEGAVQCGYCTPGLDYVGGKAARRAPASFGRGHHAIHYGELVPLYRVLQDRSGYRKGQQNGGLAWVNMTRRVTGLRRLKDRGGSIQFGGVSDVSGS